MPYPQVLRNFLTFVDGVKYVGRSEELNLPKLNIKTEEFRGGGTDAPVEIDLGMEKIEGDFTMSEYNADVSAFFGRLDSAEGTPLVFRGAAQREGEDAVAIVVTIRGKIKQVDPGSWKPGEKATTKFSYSCLYYRLEINGRAVIEIDVQNMVRVIDGTDQLASMRTALGI